MTIDDAVKYALDFALDPFVYYAPEVSQEELDSEDR